MLDFTRTRYVESHEQPVATGFTVTAEGQALVADYTGGVFAGLKPSTGASTDIFYGVSVAQQLTITEFPEFVSFVSTGTYTLPHTPIGGSILVYNVTTSSVIAFNVGVATGQYNLVGNVLTFNVAQAGNTIRVSYRYVPTTLEAQSLQGDIPPGGAANLILGTMGALVKGQVATSIYDTTVNWQGTDQVLKLGAGGRFTLGGSGATVTGAVIVSLPSTDDSYLVFEI